MCYFSYGETFCGFKFIFNKGNVLLKNISITSMKNPSCSYTSENINRKAKIMVPGILGHEVASYCTFKYDFSCHTIITIHCL